MMVMWKGQPRATPEELEYLARVRQLPCCVCLPGEQDSPTEGHHCLVGGKRIGHFFVIPLCRNLHHKQVHMLGHAMQKQLVREVHETLGITGHPWPLSKLVARR